MEEGWGGALEKNFEERDKVWLIFGYFEVSCSKGQKLKRIRQ